MSESLKILHITSQLKLRKLHLLINDNIQKQLRIFLILCFKFKHYSEIIENCIEFQTFYGVEHLSTT